MCQHLPDNRSGRLANFVRLAEFLADLIIRKYVSQEVLCQTYGLAQTIRLPDLPKFCLVCLAGPAVNNNDGTENISVIYRHAMLCTYEMILCFGTVW